MFGFENSGAESYTLLSKNVALPYGYSFAELNSNVLVFDRTGKSNVEGKITSDAIEHFLVPNILSANTHMVIADPSGALCAATKDELKNNGYDVKVFDFCHPDLKLAFNPFHIWDNETIRLFAECLAKEESPSDQFFSRGLLEYLQIIMLLVLRHAPNKYHTLSGVYEFIQMTSKNGCNPNDSLRYILYGKEDVPNFHNETVKNFLKLWKNTNSRFGPVSENPDGKSLDELGWSKDIIERSRLILGISKSVGNRAFNICASYIFRPFVISPVKEMFEKYVFDLKEFRNPGRIALFITGYSENSSFAGLTKYLISWIYHATTKSEAPVRFFFDDFESLGFFSEFDDLVMGCGRETDPAFCVVAKDYDSLKKIYGGLFSGVFLYFHSVLFLNGSESDFEYICAKKCDRSSKPKFSDVSSDECLVAIDERPPLIDKKL